MLQKRNTLLPLKNQNIRLSRLMLTALFLNAIFLTAQENNEHHLTLKIKEKDTVCLKDCFAKAHWEAHTRSFLMSTLNEGNLKDDYALASGAGIGVLTRPLRGFQVGVSGFFMYNLFSSNLHQADSLTGLPNRYEVGLFDIENHSNKRDLDRLEELYLKYTLSKSSIAIGKINLNTPFFNPQDGRMRPTIEEGVWLSIKESATIGFNGGWIWAVSPRSTVEWYSIANSMGVYPMGVTTDGTKAAYKDEIQGCSGMAVTNVYIRPSKAITLNLWNGYLENVMNTALLELTSEQALGRLKLYQGAIYLHQNAVNNGGNAEQRLTYMTKGEQSNVISAQLGIKGKLLNTNINYTHITGDGRYMMPREWGRELFYTFLNRERNEGLGNLHAFMVKSTLTAPNTRFKTAIGYGYYLLPDVKNYRLNKYGMPSYHQINYYANYSFSRFLKGLDLKFIAAYKIKAGETYNNLKFVFNKVNMINLNLVLDFKI